MAINVINARGENEIFSWKKVYRSARRVGAGDKLAKKIAGEIQSKAYDEMKTSEIFGLVKQFLAQETPVASIRFNLKDAMRRLGPSGFKFEKYIAAIFFQMGYNVEINQMIDGACLKQYEIDFVAKSQRLKELKIGECKYHNVPGGMVDVDIALSNYARFLDIADGAFLKKKSLAGFNAQSVIATNTRFSSRAIKYCRAKNVEMLGWNYPLNKGLEYLIDTKKLYPITILPSLSNYLAEVFANEHLMLAGDLLSLDSNAFSSKLNIPRKQIDDLVNEAKLLLNEN